MAERWLKVAELLQKLPAAEVSCVISAPGADKRRAFYKRFEKFGRTEVLDLPDLRGARETAAWVREVQGMMKAAGLDADEGVAERLVELLGNQTRLFAQRDWEAGAVCASAPAGDGGGFAGHRVGGAGGVGVGFVRRGDGRPGGGCAAALRQLLEQGESEVGILIRVGPAGAAGGVGAVLQEKKWLRLTQRGSFVNAEISPQAEELLPTNKSGAKPNAYRLARVVSQAQGRRPEQWFAAVEEVYQAYQKMLGAVGD
ncbi:MAG: hypothetical protein HC901_04425, partial [Bdellovibrionaceae bacterium]|nr:hypothetical protein [Pseudobdellovibrionaceae bacterium]